jgi:hypothetical protein
MNAQAVNNYSSRLRAPVLVLAAIGVGLVVMVIMFALFGCTSEKSRVEKYLEDKYGIDFVVVSTSSSTGVSWCYSADDPTMPFQVLSPERGVYEDKYPVAILARQTALLFEQGFATAGLETAVDITDVGFNTYAAVDFSGVNIALESYIAKKDLNDINVQDLIESEDVGMLGVVVYIAIKDSGTRGDELAAKVSEAFRNIDEMMQGKESLIFDFFIIRTTNFQALRESVREYGLSSGATVFDSVEWLMLAKNDGDIYESGRLRSGKSMSNLIGETYWYSEEELADMEEMARISASR